MGDKIEEKIDRIEKAVAENTQGISNLGKTVDTLAAVVKQNSNDITDLVKIVVGMKEYMETNLVTKDELAEQLGSLREEVVGKVEGVQRGLDANFQRHSALEARVSKIEVELHPQNI